MDGAPQVIWAGVAPPAPPAPAVNVANGDPNAQEAEEASDSDVIWEHEYLADDEPQEQPLDLEEEWLASLASMEDLRNPAAGADNNSSSSSSSSSSDSSSESSSSTSERPLAVEAQARPAAAEGVVENAMPQDDAREAREVRAGTTTSCSA